MIEAGRWGLGAGMDGTTLIDGPSGADRRHHGNLGSHKVAGIREAIEACGASLLYLPPYSPDLNPIELSFSKPKALIRKAAARAREALWNAIGRFLSRFAPQECANYFAKAGYAT